MPMQKIINNPGDFVDEMLEGVLLAHPEDLRRAGDPRVIVRADAPRPGKVGIVTGGGSGHLPVFMGYVGFGLADGVAVGNVFASPSSEQILEATREVDGDAGVLYLYGNYSGDVMNFDLAAELAEAEGIEVATVLAADDVASAPKGSELRRRGNSRHRLAVQGGRGRGRRKGRHWPRWSRPPMQLPTGCAPWVSPCRLACCPRRGIPPSTFPRGRWRSGWGSTVSRACGGESSNPLSASPSNSWATSSTTCPTAAATRWRCWSTGSGDSEGGALHTLPIGPGDPFLGRDRRAEDLGGRVRHLARDGGRDLCRCCAWTTNWPGSSTPLASLPS